MNGKLIVSIILGIAAATGMGLWYNQNNAYYVEVNGLTEVTARGETLPVREYRGIDADTSPLKMRACFTVDWFYEPSGDHRDMAQPLVAPHWFDCFDAEQIHKDIRAGDATAILAEDNHPFGFSRYIAHYPDGRAFMWRQINSCGGAKSLGEDLPENCAPNATPEPPQSRRAVAPSLLLDQEFAIRLVPIIGGSPEKVDTGDVEVSGNTDDVFSQQGCFTLALSFGLLTETYQIADEASPQTTADGMPCFDAAQLSEDLEVGYALAFWGEKEVEPGVDRVVAVHNDGRAFVWHQRNENYVD